MIFFFCGKNKIFLSAFAWGLTHAMQALTNVPMEPSTAASESTVLKK